MKKIVFIFFIMFCFIVKTEAGSVTINRYDLGGDRLEATLVGSIVELYEDNHMIEWFILDETGTVFFDGLKEGRYGVKQGKAKGYKQDIQTYNFYISNEFPNAVINLYSNVIEGNLIINKYCGEEEESFIDEEAVFQIYHNDNLIKTLKVENGIISTKLEYGTYKIKQVSGKKYYYLKDEFTVKIEREKDYIFNLYTDMETELKEIINNKDGEILNTSQNLDNVKNELEKEKENLIKLEEALNKQKIEIEALNKELILKENELKELQNKSDSNNNIIIDLENELDNKNKEMLLLKKYLKEKQIQLEEQLNEFNIKEKEYNNLLSNNKNLNGNPLIVNVPNTYKKNYKKEFSFILIIIGMLFTICGIKKVTNH